MESPGDVSLGFLSLLPEPPDPDLVVMLLVDPPVPPVPPDPPPILLDAGVLSIHLLLMHPLLDDADLSSSLTTRRVSSFLQLIPVSKPRNLVSCWKHILFKSFLRNLSYYQQAAVVIEISVASFLGLLTADGKLPSFITHRFKFSRTGLRIATFWSAALHCYVQFSVKVYPSFETLVTCCWSHLPLLQAFARRSVFRSKQEIMLFLNGSLPRIEDVITPLSFRSSSIYHSLSMWSWQFASQQSILWRRCLVSSEFVDVCSTVEYVKNFPTCSANGTWIMSATQNAKAEMLQKAPPSTLSSGLLSLQILADSIVPFFALRSELVLAEITGFFTVRNLVPLVIPLSCFYNLCIIFCLIVVAFVMGDVPKLCFSNALF
ncbi:unnamed protein product [Eruca vesicaria subsp. sativa]|uniref:Uncharacterized protein n=1 Tax=Eruca vesicaria subsp. sativa TaxID=29727 RepID=A0ABC8JBH9_ERUVS|nr:unnamed protein product [Eruca vesicaria subsp. sativa]